MRGELTVAGKGMPVAGRWMLLLVLAGVLGGLLWYRNEPADLRPALSGEGVATESVRPVGGSGSTVRQAFGTDDGSPVVAMQPADRARRDFEDADDLYAYVQGLYASASAGEPMALWMISRAYDYCAGYAAGPTGFAGDTRVLAGLDQPAARTMVAARERVARRCARFLPDDGLTSPAIVALRVDAAEAGSLAAEAALLAMGKPLVEGDEYARGLVQRVHESRDPDAYVALSPAMGLPASGQESVYGPVSGVVQAELAWQLAACRLGLDCSADGALMTGYCVNGGICSNDQSQDFDNFVFDAGVPRQGRSKVEDMVQSLLLGSRSDQR